MRSKLKVIVPLLLLAVLLVPFQAARLRDGGTLDVRALGYRIVRWHSLTGNGDEVFSALRFYPFPLNFRPLDELRTRELSRTAQPEPSTPENAAQTLPAVEGTAAEVAHMHGSIRLTLPAGWTWTEIPPTEDNVDFGIRFAPENADGAVTLTCGDAFGVCGTGLTEREIPVRDGTALLGTYDDNAAWSFLYFNRAAGTYFATNDGLSGGALDTALEILQTAVLGEGELPRAKALEIGASALGTDAAHVYGEFDLSDGSWQVSLFGKSRQNPADTVIVLPDGTLKTETP